MDPGTSTLAARLPRKPTLSRILRGLAAMCLAGQATVAPGCSDANDDSVVRTADCSMCSDDLAATCSDTYTTCIGNGGLSDDCQREIDALCAPDGGQDAGDGAVTDGGGVPGPGDASGDTGVDG